MTKNSLSLKKIPFDVHIPNLDGDGTAEIITIEAQAYADPETGQDVLTAESLDLIEKTQARHMGLMTADEIRSLRRRLGLSQEEMCDLLQIGRKTYTRWESGRARPSRSMNIMLSALRDGQLGVNYLRALRDPGLQPAWNIRATVDCFVSFSLNDKEAFQGELRSPRLSPLGQGSSTLWTWRHHREMSNSPPVRFDAVLANLLHSFWAEEDEDVPSLSRNRSAREQSGAFKGPRFAQYLTDEVVSG